MFAHFGAKHCRVCRRCWALALQNAVNTVKNCCAERWAAVLSVLLLLWLARALRGPCLFPVGFRAFWRTRARATPATKRCYLRCFVAFALPGWLAGCSFWAGLSGAFGACARPHVSLPSTPKQHTHPQTKQSQPGVNKPKFD